MTFDERDRSPPCGSRILALGRLARGLRRPRRGAIDGSNREIDGSLRNRRLSEQYTTPFVQVFDVLVEDLLPDYGVLCDQTCAVYQLRGVS